MAYTIAFFGSKPYDEASFNEKNKEYGFELRYYKGHLNKHNVILTQGVDAVCIFVNDTADTEVIRLMADNGVKLLALRCAGYNNVDLKAAADRGITVVRVPAYSPYAVAEYTVALMLSLNRKIPRATWRQRDCRPCRPALRAAGPSVGRDAGGWDSPRQRLRLQYTPGSRALHTGGCAADRRAKIAASAAIFCVCTQGLFTEN